MRISDWSSDVCSSDLSQRRVAAYHGVGALACLGIQQRIVTLPAIWQLISAVPPHSRERGAPRHAAHHRRIHLRLLRPLRSEEHTSELQSLMRISYAVFCLKNNIN